MSKAKQLTFFLVFQGLGFLFLIAQVVYSNLEDELDLYIITGLGLPVVLFPMIPIGTRLGKAKQAGLIPLPFYLIAAAMSTATNAFVFTFTNEDYLVGSIMLLFTALFWSYALYLDGGVRPKFKKIIAWFSRGCITFLILFMPAFWFYIPIRAYCIGINPLQDSLFDVLIGVAMMCLLVFSWLVSRYRIAGITSSIMFLYWYTDISQWMLRNWDRLLIAHEGTWTFVLTMTIVLAVNTGMTIAKLFGETTVLVNSGRSGFFGPWYFSFKQDLSAGRPIKARKRQINKGLKIGLILAAFAVPGALPIFNLTPVPVTIKPRTDYTMRFNFWASSDLNGTYTPAMITTLNDHQVNLDITTSISPSSIQTLIDFEYEMPNITYRTTIAPPHFDQMYETVVYQAELIIPYISNGTLDQWKGFAFDIEGDHYRWWLGFDTVEEAIAEWEQTFDYVYNNATAQVGYTIEMENVGSHFFDAEMLFDGDMDMQLIEGYVNNVPANFTSHGSMVYRCMVDDCFEQESIWAPWRTSYTIYDALYTLNGTVGEDKLGIYLGITNCSCYGQDLPQNELITWGETTGLGNLIRDTLIAKYFGLKEVTYFLLWSTPIYVDGPSAFGVFDSYGIDFLDVMNTSVNTNPPEEFNIYYNYADADVSRSFYRDVLGDISRPFGMGLVIAAAIASVFIVILSERYRKRKERKPE